MSSIRARNKINAGFSMASMTDIVFLLLIFFMITSTLIAPNALKLLLPQSRHQTMAKPITTVSITRDFEFFVETTQVEFSQLEGILQQKMMNAEDPTISLHVDRSVPMEQVVRVMNIARNNQYKLILATSSR
jgi:biopolymer transport protein ExbD